MRTVSKLAPFFLAVVALGWYGCGTEDNAVNGGEGVIGGAAGNSGGSVGDAGQGPTEKEISAACDCYVAGGLIDHPLGTENCRKLISDDCVACYRETVDRGACDSVTLADLAVCVHRCPFVADPPALAAECRNLAAALLSDPARQPAADCLCENCLDDFAYCMIGRGCWSVVSCAMDRGCYADECRDDAVCGPVFSTAEQEWSEVRYLVVEVANCDSGHDCSGLNNPYPAECRLEKMSFNQQTGCRNDGFMEFCIDDSEAELLRAVQEINPDIDCHAGYRGRADCQPDSEKNCAFPLETAQCVENYPAMTDEPWQQLCQISALDGVRNIVPTWLE
jgi:hypothetical protein